MAVVTACSLSAGFAQERSAFDRKIMQAALGFHQTTALCALEDRTFENSELIRFSASSHVVLIVCERHAYQTSHVAYSVSGESDPYVELLSFPDNADGQKWTASHRIISPDWNGETKRLTTFYKGRGIGDCGSSAVYRWEDHAFIPEEVRFQTCCWDEESFETVPACKKIKDDYPIPEDEWPVVFRIDR
ncbi:MAG: DUF1176 domain-containing protein [Pseudomonadota bacterium]